MSRTGAGVAAGLIAIGCLTAAGCANSSATTTTTTPISLTTPPTTSPPPTVVPRPGVYRMGAVAVRISFPGTPVMQVNPPTLTALLPAGTKATSWSVGDLGALQVHSYELVMATFPPGSTVADLDRFLAHYDGTPNTTLYGRPALRKLSTIPSSGPSSSPSSNGNDFSGITAFSVGRVLVIAVGYDDVQANVKIWLDSLKLVSSAR